MTAMHDPGEVWHIGWDWHANLWYVEPPFDVELPGGEPAKWFNERYEAFEFVDKYIREQPVRVSVLDETWGKEVTLPAPEPQQDIPAYVPRSDRAPEPIPEPSWESLVTNPVATQAALSRAERLSRYESRVGLRR